MRRLRNLALAAALILPIIAASCDDRAERVSVVEFTGMTMGTSYSVKLVGVPESMDMEWLRWQLQQELTSIEQQMSTYIADSELSQFNARRSVDWFEVSPELCNAVANALAISAASRGAFDITVGPLVNLWGFGPDGSNVEPPDEQSIASERNNVGYTALHADCSAPALRKDRPDVYVDLSAFAKGYGVDRLAAILDRERLERYLVEIGGELRMRGLNANGEKWGIAIESPHRSGRAVQTIVRLTDVAVATSGDYRNFFEHEGRIYSHTIDPRTGYPVTHTAASVTVLAETAAVADAMATALLVLGPDDGLRFAEREGLAALFLVRSNSETEEVASSSFTERVKSRRRSP